MSSEKVTYDIQVVSTAQGLNLIRHQITLQEAINIAFNTTTDNNIGDITTINITKK